MTAPAGGCGAITLAGFRRNQGAQPGSARPNVVDAFKRISDTGKIVTTKRRVTDCRQVGRKASDRSSWEKRSACVQP